MLCIVRTPQKRVSFWLLLAGGSCASPVVAYTHIRKRMTLDYQGGGVVTPSLPCALSVLGGQVLSSLALCIVLPMGLISIGKVLKDPRGRHS